MSPFPVTALSFLISLVILAIGGLLRAVVFILTGTARGGIRSVARRQWVSLSVVALIAGGCVGYYSFLFLAAVERGENNFMVAYDVVHQCDPIEVPGDRPYTVILRLDDVQAFGWSNLSLSMMRDAHARDLPIVAGVIPFELEQNTSLVRFLRHNQCNVEIALHGYTHNDEGVAYSEAGRAEFEHLSYRAASKRLALADEAITNLVPHYEPVSFIPPQNKLSPAAERSLYEAGIHVVSTEGQKHFDYDAAAWNYNEERFVPTNEIMAQCDATFARGDDLCVIMLHPQDYTSGGERRARGKYHEYRMLLSTLAEREDVAVMTFAQYLDLKAGAVNF